MWLDENNTYLIIERVSDMIVTVFTSSILWVKTNLNYNIGDKNEYSYDNSNRNRMRVRRARG